MVAWSDDVQGLSGLGDLLGHAAVEREEAIAIVDPYSSGRFLVEELRRRSWPLVAVRSSLAIDEALLGTWNPVPFEQAVVHRGSVSETVEALRAVRPIRAVIAGSEPGVELAEALASAMSLRGNDPDTPRPRCRWDKYDMHEQLSRSGLRACQQKLCTSIEEARAFAAELGAWPVVAKPRHSHGGACVHLCHDSDALAEAVKTVLGSQDPAGRAYDVVLVQEFLEGSEYVVDCVSLDGEHLVVATWALAKTKTPTGVAYDTTSMLAYEAAEDSLQQRLYRYVLECLTALGVRNGASHSEVVLGESGPCLVKTGARMHGAMGPALWTKCAGRKQAQPYLVADVFAEDGAEFRQRLASVRDGEPAYDLSRLAMQVDLQCPKGGVLDQSIEAASGSWLRALPTFLAFRLFVEEDDYVAPTRDVSTSPGFVVLLGETAADTDRDRAAIRERERSGRMYRLREETSDRASRRARSYSTNPAGRLRELEAEAEKLISPIVSRAASPVLSPQQAPLLPPEWGSSGDLFEFTLDGADGLDDGALSLDAGFSLDAAGPPSMQPLNI